MVDAQIEMLKAQLDGKTQSEKMRGQMMLNRLKVIQEELKTKQVDEQGQQKLTNMKQAAVQPVSGG
jgi:hypothetical protein